MMDVPIANGLDQVLEAILNLSMERTRILVAISGPPGLGKSTTAEKLAKRLGPESATLPLDGFHFENDLTNVDFVLNNMRTADLILREKP